MTELIYILIGWNIVTCAMMAIDKYKAIHDRRRIREQTLLTSAFAMGGLGSVVGSIIFRHKTRKWKFRLLLPIAFIFNVSVIFLIWYYVL